MPRRTMVRFTVVPLGPRDIAAQLDSMAVGSTSAVKANAGDNTLNIVKLVAKQELPDSVLLVFLRK